MRYLAPLLAAALLMGAVPTFGQSATNETRSSWWVEVERLAEALDAGRYAKVRKRAPKLAYDIAARSWYHPELPQIFAELALYEAVARAYLGEEDLAVWLWHTALNIHPPMRDLDVSPYGEAGKLFRENPLRAAGEIPYRWSHAVHGPQFGVELIRPRKLDEAPPVVLHSLGVREPGATRPMQIELILDEHGAVHQPRIHLPVGAHPAIQWSVLRWVPARAFAPGSLDGEARPFLFTLEVSFQVLRGASREGIKDDGLSG